jgi:3-deoxy-D-manno-octulosonic acid kinase
VNAFTHRREWLARSAAAWKTVSFSVRTDFMPIRRGGRVLYLRPELAGTASAILVQIAQLDRESRTGAGIRCGGFVITVDERTTLFLRRSRRGGLIRWLNRDLYFGAPKRPLRELIVAAEACRRGLPVAQPVGALIEPLVPGIYRAAILTHRLNGMTLWEFVEADDDPLVRTYVFEQARRAIEKIHKGGLLHADLNLHNLFVTHAGESFTVVILDLDKARLYRNAVPAPLRQRNLRRLVRSARKLDPERRIFDDNALGILTGASS